MEEVQQHLRAEFERIECSFMDEWSGDLSSLSSAQCFEAIVRLLWTIQPALKSSIPSVLLPPAATARFRVATTVANAVKSVGVRHEVGFQSLLYGSGKEFTATFIELVRLVPREKEDEQPEELSPREALLQRARALAAEDVLWVPEFCRLLKLKHDGRFWCPNETEPEQFPLSSVPPSVWSLLDSVDCRDRRALAATLVSTSSQHGHHQIASSAQLTVDESRTVTRNDLPPKSSKPQLAPKPKPEDAARRAEMEEATALLEEALAKMSKVKGRLGQADSRKEAAISAKTAASEALSPYDEKLMRMLEDPLEARVKVEQFLDERDERVRQMEKKWEGVRVEKEDELETLKETLAIKSKAISPATRLARAREELGRLEHMQRLYLQREKKLRKRVEGLSSGEIINRHAYVKRLIEITNNIKKQREELSKVWKETDLLLKDIKWTDQAIQRTFDLLENTLYNKIELHDRSIKEERVYKNFCKMHNQCQLIVRTVENTGHAKMREEQLLDKLEIARQAAYRSILDEMMTDLESIKIENIQLQESLAEA